MRRRGSGVKFSEERSVKGAPIHIGESQRLEVAGMPLTTQSVLPVIGPVLQFAAGT